MFSDVLFIFSDVVRMFSIAHRYSMNILRCAQDVDVFRCSKMLSDVQRCSWMFAKCSLGVLRMFSGCSQDVYIKYQGYSGGSGGPVGCGGSCSFWLWYNL